MSSVPSSPEDGGGNGRGEAEAADGLKMPRSKRGMRTRGALVDAARRVFERDGYLDARISDISDAASVAAGSFYTYFNSKEEVFAAVVAAVQEDMLHPVMDEPHDSNDPIETLKASNRAYLLSYQRNARLMMLFEQVAVIDQQFRDMRLRRSTAFADRNSKAIRRLQEMGAADPDIDPDVAARALGGMVARMAYLAFVLEDPVPFDLLVGTVTQLWVNALKMAIPAPTEPTAT